MAATLDELRPKLREFCRTRPIERLAVFGSFAKGTARKESDLDLLVTLPPGLPQEEIFLMAGEIEEAMGLVVDFIESDRLASSSNSLKRDAILDSAIVVYER